MITVAVLRTIVAADVSDFERGMRRAGDGFADLEKKAQAAPRVSEIVTGAMRQVGASVALAAAQAAKAVFDYGNKAADMASDINESVSKINTLFGKNAAEVERWSATTAKSLGISQRSALEYSGTFGNLFRAMNVGQKASADLSKNLVKLAADYASFNNTSIEDALEAIRAGLVGESEPLRRYGVMLNEASIKQQALKMGLISSTKEALEPQTKALATIELMYKQSAAAQGDFAKTSDGAANTQRILNAQLEDAQAKLGKYALPLKTFTMRTFVAALDSAVPALERFGENAAKSFGTVGPVLRQTWNDVQQFVKPATDFMVQQWSYVTNWIKTNLPLMRETVGTIVRTINEWWRDHGAQIKAVAAAAWGAVKTIVETGTKVLLGTLRLIMQVINGDWSGAWKTFQKIIGDAVTGSARLMMKGRDLFYSAMVYVSSGILDVGKRMVTATVRLGYEIVTGLANGIRQKVADVKGAAVEMAQAVPDQVRKLLRIQSPSRVLFEAGIFVATGFASGIDAGTVKAAAAAQRMATAAAEAAGGGGGRSHGKRGGGKGADPWERAGMEAGQAWLRGLISMQAAWVAAYLEQRKRAVQGVRDLLRQAEREALVAKYGEQSAPVIRFDYPEITPAEALKAAQRIASFQRSAAASNAYNERVKESIEAPLMNPNAALSDFAEGARRFFLRNDASGREPGAAFGAKVGTPTTVARQGDARAASLAATGARFLRDAFEDMTSGSGEQVVRRFTSRIGSMLRESVGDALQRGIEGSLRKTLEKGLKDAGGDFGSVIKATLESVEASVYRALSQTYALLSTLGAMGKRRQRGGLFGALLGGAVSLFTGGAALPLITGFSGLGSAIAGGNLGEIALAGVSAYQGGLFSGLTGGGGAGGYRFADMGNPAADFVGSGVTGRSRSVAISFNGPMTFGKGYDHRDVARELAREVERDLRRAA